MAVFILSEKTCDKCSKKFRDTGYPFFRIKDVVVYLCEDCTEDTAKMLKEWLE